MHRKENRIGNIFYCYLLCMSLVGVSGYLPSHSLDTKEKEMSDTDVEVTLAITVFIVKRGLL